jgi:N utilization substance protein A
MSDLGEEKIDIIPYAEDPAEYIANALSPTKVINVTLDESDKKAVVRVPEDQLSLAIGKQGQNVRLAAKLTGWNIDIVSADESRVEAVADAAGPKRDLEGDMLAAINSGAGPEGGIDPNMDEEATGAQTDALSGQGSDDETPSK